MKTLSNLFSTKQEPDIDPYQVGSLIGPRAFTAGDWVVIIPSSNRPAKVRRRELTGAIRVILGNESDAVYGETCYYASELGYPLSIDLWSESQKRRYADYRQNKSGKRFNALSLEDILKWIAHSAMLWMAVTLLVVATTDIVIPIARDYSHKIMTAIQEFVKS